MPINKSSFQPKDARTYIMSYEDEEEDEDVIFNEGKRKFKTGTQALVEFLQNTSPEEFQRAVPEKPTQTLFSRIRKTKRNTTSTVSSPKKSPIIPIPSSRSVPSGSLTRSFGFSTSNNLSRTLRSSSTTLASATLGSNRGPASYNTFPRKKHIEIIPQPTFRPYSAEKPILPNKKRESSLLNHPSYSAPDSQTMDQFMKARNGLDLIETGLLQRLERLQLESQPIPSDVVATDLALEHIRALGITHQLDNQAVLANPKTKIRHMQVQTEAWLESIPVVQEKKNEEAVVGSNVRAERAEAALKNALDHFEVLNGLSYKKLRELWEEKMRWENACMELRERVMDLERQKRTSSNSSKFQGQLSPIRGDYFLEENDEDELLSKLSN